MIDERLARQWCDLLGWTWKRYGAPFERPGPWVSWRNDRAEVTIPHIDGARVYVVDLPTLATCALVRHAGPVDVGSCQECGGQLAVGWADGAAEDEGWYEDGVWLRDCPACVVDGKPTGRRVVSAPEAVLLAAPEWCETCAGSGEPGNGAWVDWLDESSDDEPARRAPPTECPDCRGQGFTSGHEGSREALRGLAEGWREHLRGLPDPRGEAGPEERAAVWGDWLRWRGAPESLARCPKRPAWVLAWLAGECPACGGRGANEYCERCSAPTDEVYGRVSSGRAIGPHLPAIYAHLTVWAWLDSVLP